MAAEAVAEEEEEQLQGLRQPEMAVVAAEGAAAAASAAASAAAGSTSDPEGCPRQPRPSSSWPSGPTAADRHRRRPRKTGTERLGWTPERGGQRQDGVVSMSPP